MDYTKMLEEVKTLNNTEQEKALALAIHLELDPTDHTDVDSFLSQLASSESNNNTFEIDGKEYLVLTDEEAEEAYDEYLNNYIDDLILSEIPEQYRSYFDSKKWKKDEAYYIDDRSSALGYYDGQEHEEAVNKTDYYIYRIN